MWKEKTHLAVITAETTFHVVIFKVIINLISELNVSRPTSCS